MFFPGLTGPLDSFLAARALRHGVQIVAIPMFYKVNPGRWVLPQTYFQSYPYDVYWGT